MTADFIAAQLQNHEIGYTLSISDSSQLSLAIACGMGLTKVRPGEMTQAYDATHSYTTLTEDSRATSIGNMHRKFGKDLTCSSEQMITDRQTHTQTEQYSGVKM